MDCAKVGKLICQVRKEQGRTQKNIADALNISNKTVSKWERGLGCPDVSLLMEHEMNKSHFIFFIAYVVDDIILLKRLYPEQSANVHIPALRRGGRLYAHCCQHGLWE